MMVDSIDLESFVEPYFVIRQSTSLRCPDRLSADRYLSHVNYRLLKEPGSLTDHVRKVYLLQDQNLNPKMLTAALVDLFLILESAGYALRRRLLLTSRELISVEVFERLSGKLKNGKLSMSENWIRELPTLLVEKSALKVVRKQARQSYNSAGNPEVAMRLADEYIENSQIDQAMETLEESVLKAPDDAEPASLLIELYRQTADYDRFRNFLDKLNKSHAEVLSDSWQMASLEFEQL